MAKGKIFVPTSCVDAVAPSMRILWLTEMPGEIFSEAVQHLGWALKLSFGHDGLDVCASISPRGGTRLPLGGAKLACGLYSFWA
jgi:hypothetical protein